MISLLSSFLRATALLWCEMAPYILLGMVIAGVMHICMDKNFVRRQLGQGGIWSIVKATLLGVPLPVCSCGVIPLADSLRRDGAHRSSVLAFLVSTPTTGIDSILATYALLGPLYAIFRPLAALVTGITLGVSDYFLAGKEGYTPDTKPKPCAHCGKEHHHERTRFKEFLHHTFVDIPADLAKWLVIGVLAGGAITVALPADIFSHYLGFPWDFFAAIGVGIPLYVCATGSIPIATALIAKGMSPGAALAFLIAGPATNTVTMAFVWAKLGKRSFYIYLANIIIIAFLSGMIFNYFWPVWSGKMINKCGGEMLPFGFNLTCGLILLALVLGTFRKQNRCFIDPH